MPTSSIQASNVWLTCLGTTGNSIVMATTWHFRFLLYLLFSCMAFVHSLADAAVWVQADSQAHTAPIMRLAVDASRNVVVTASDDKTARVWELSSGKSITVLRPPVGPGRSGRLFGAAIHPTQNLVAVAGSTNRTSTPGPSIWIFQLDNGRFVRRIDARGEHVRRLQWSSDGSLLIACYADPGAIRAFDLTGNLTHEERLKGDCFAIANRGSAIAAATRDRQLHLYQKRDLQLQSTARITLEADPLAADYSPDASRIVLGFFTKGVGASVYDVKSGRRQLQLRTAHGYGDISKTMAVSWAADGKTIVTAGVLDSDGKTEGRLQRFDAATGARLSDTVIAEDTITDLVDLSATKGAESSPVAWASFDGTWGVSNTRSSQIRSHPQIEFIIRRGADQLLISERARKVRWRRGVRRTPVSFELGARRVGADDQESLHAPVTRRSFFSRAENFVNHYRPTVGNQAVKLAVGEVSRALTYIGSDGHVVLATDLGIRRLDSHLNVVWQQSTATEVRAVNASVDGLLLVTTMSDGTVRWWRARDGALLLTALVTANGWVIWSPTGHYDASHGAETLIGWLVDRSDGHPVPDYFTVGRFREQFNRPDVIDRVLDVMDPEQAVRQADAARAAAPNGLATNYQPNPQSAGAAVVPAQAGAPAAPADLIRPTEAVRFPPVLAALDTLRLAVGPQPRPIRFSIRTPTPAESVRIEVRLDGRLTEPDDLRLPERLDGSEPAQALIDMDESTQSVQIVARTGQLASEPLRYTVKGSQLRALEPIKRDGTLYLLAVGVAKYHNPNYHLALTAKDAQDFARIMSDQHGGLYREIKLRVLTDEKATKGAILSGLDWLQQQVTAQDVGMLFLAGHGVNDSRGTFRFLLPQYSEQQLDATSITDQAIAARMSRLRGRAVIFLDTCYAGSVTTALNKASRRTDRFANSMSAPENSVSVFASSTGFQESLENDRWGNGAFTKIVVDGLTGAARIPALNAVTARSLSPYLLTGVSELTNGLQTPVALIPDSMPDRILAIPSR